MEVSGCGKVFVDLAYAVTGKTNRGARAGFGYHQRALRHGLGKRRGECRGGRRLHDPSHEAHGLSRTFCRRCRSRGFHRRAVHASCHGSRCISPCRDFRDSYVQVIKIAAIPACLYFASVGVIIYLEAVKRGLRGMPASRTTPVHRSHERDPPSPSDPDSDRIAGHGYHSLRGRFLHHLRNNRRELVPEGVPNGALQNNNRPGGGRPCRRSRWDRSSGFSGS